MVIRASTTNGFRGVCIREIQKSLKESAKKLIEDKIESLGLGGMFEVLNDQIKTPGGGVIIFQGMQDHTAESIKSLEGFDVAWVEEAQTLSATSLRLLRPTIRKANSELWFSWNPTRKTDPVDVMLRQGELPTDAIVIKANWSENAKFPEVLEQERQDCMRTNPDQYEHIWEGGYITVAEGAYYAKSLAKARSEGRIGRVGADPLLTVRLFVDIGGTGAKADAFALWAAQYVGTEIRWLKYYEAQGQELGFHLQWLRANDYGPDRAQIWLPHDGATHDRVFNVSYESAFKDAGYKVTVIPNQGKGAASKRIEEGRRLFPQMWFDEEGCKGGLDALGWYHERKDETRNIGLGPEHDWASHGCFAGDTKVLTRYGMQCIMNLPKNGEVLTPCGWKTYILPRITKRNAQLVEVRFAGGYSVKCTPDHLFLTESGWKSAESLERNTVIQSTLTKSRSISMAVCTAFGRAITIFQGVGKGFTGLLGRLHLAKSQKVVISTTGTEMFLTTGSITWSAWTHQNTCQNQEASASSLMMAGLAQTQGKKLLTGMARKKEGFGIADMPRDQKAGQSGNEKRSLVSIAASYFKHLLERVETLANIVLKPAKRLRIESVTKLNHTEDVWDITVPSFHCFSLENGAVVHNSDAFGLGCVAHDPPSKPLEYKPPRHRPNAGNWMR